MKKVVILSDTHGAYYEMQDVINKESNTDIFIHLGDFEIPDYLMSSFLCVKGNCDYSSSFPLSRDIEIEGFNIHLEHGNGFRISYDIMSYLKDLKCDIFLFGHTHRKMDYKIEETLMLNPGSLMRPRDDNQGSYLVLYLEKGKEIKYEFLTLK